ncbi:MAG: hypothetical protein BWY66_02867 [bacterium ADurb.Bin374]|nr:MAG: hypothetical protein BWY66_02867 [bacterium ADurb.Bin374]
MSFQCQIDDSLHQRMGGMDQFGGRSADAVDQAHECFLETYPVVSRDDGSEIPAVASTEPAVAFPDGGGNVGNGPATGFAGLQIAALPAEGFFEEGPDEVGLEFSGLGFFHRRFHGEQAIRIHDFFAEGVLGDDIAQAGRIEGTFDTPEEFLFAFGVFAVSDGVDQEVAQASLVEHVAENVEHAAAEGFSLDFEFFEQTLEHVAFAGLVGDEVPEEADFGLADAVDAAEALFDAVRVPGQIVIDHEAGVLEVDAFAGGIGRDEDTDVGVVAEELLGLAPVFALRAAVDGDDGAGVAEQAADFHGQVVQGVAVFGENDELPLAPFPVMHLGGVLEEVRQFFPFAVFLGVDNLAGLGFETGEGLDFSFELGNRLGGGGLIDQELFEFFGLLGVEIVGIFHVAGHVGGARLGDDVPAAQEFRLFELARELLPAALERLVDRFGAGGQPALE